MANCMQAMKENSAQHVQVLSADGGLEHELHLNDLVSYLHLVD